MNKYHIELTEQEAALVENINFCKSHPNHGKARAAFEANKAPILALLRSLIERGAIPQERMNYWKDPDYNMGRMNASKKGVFERNGCTGQDIYTHPHFISYLRYFLFGADLPDAVIAKFEEMVGNTGFVTSGDIVPISKYARELARQHRLDQAHVPEDFFKLCLDMGLGLDTAAGFYPVSTDGLIKTRLGLCFHLGSISSHRHFTPVKIPPSALISSALPAAKHLVVFAQIRPASKALCSQMDRGNSRARQESLELAFRGPLRMERLS